MDSVTVAGLHFPLAQMSTGLSTQHGYLEPLAWVVNAAVSGAIPDFVDRVQRKEPVGWNELFAIPMDPTRDLDLERRQWKEWSGREIGSDAYQVGTTFTGGTILIPRAVLLGLVAALLKLRVQATSATAHNETPKTIQPDAQSMAEANQVYLENQAELLEQLIVTRPDDVAAVSVKRQFLLRELEHAGMFSEADMAVNRQQLLQLDLHRLISYIDAVSDIYDYYRSSERKKLIPDATELPIIGGIISVDWFRLPVSIPAGMTPYNWLAYCELTFRLANVPEGDMGEVFSRVGAGWYSIRWRKDDGIHPSIYAASPN